MGGIHYFPLLTWAIGLNWKGVKYKSTGSKSQQENRRENHGKMGFSLLLSLQKTESKGSDIIMWGCFGDFTSRILKKFG
jgi:hypothetical protein